MTICIRLSLHIGRIRRFGVARDDGVMFQNAAGIFIGWSIDQLPANRPSTLVPFWADTR
jgi:hypothetical protein